VGAHHRTGRRGRPARALSLAAGAAACLLSTLTPAPAQPAGDARRGRELAVRLCTNCHVVDSAASGPRRADVPAFPAIAKRPGVTPERLAGAIIIPHPAMPGVQLTTAEIRDIVAYILSLQGN
jgi:mono/diheme cytochrome c family protein